MEFSKPAPVLFSDFDGVWNFMAPLKDYHQMPHAYQKTSKAFVTAFYKRWELNWSDQLVKETLALKEDTGFTFEWVTSWTGYTDIIDQTLGITSDCCHYWEPENTDHDFPSKEAYYDNEKLKAVTASICTNPRPFVWLDDTATKLWTEAMSSKMSVPHLVITTSLSTGLNIKEFKKIAKFMQANGNTTRLLEEVLKEQQEQLFFMHNMPWLAENIHIP